MLAAGHAEQALALIDPVVASQLTLRDVPGNWWAKTALVKSSALEAMNRTSDAVALLKDLTIYSKDPRNPIGVEVAIGPDRTA